MSNEIVLQKLDQGLLTITMNRPDRRNALNPDMTRGLVEAARRAADDHEVRAVLLKGAVLGWILRSPARIPHLFPLSSTWLFILFGLGAVNFARHPEGVLEDRKRKAAEKYQKRLDRAAAAPASSPVEV